MCRNKEAIMGEDERKRLKEEILNKRIVDYGNYRFVYNIATGEVTIYENAQCVIKKANAEAAIDFFDKKEAVKKKQKDDNYERAKYTNQKNNRDFGRERCRTQNNINEDSTRI